MKVIAKIAVIMKHGKVAVIIETSEKIINLKERIYVR